MNCVFILFENFKNFIMKKITLISFVTFLLILLFSSSMYSQLSNPPIILDGENCEWSEISSAPDLDEGYPSSAELLNLWVAQDTDYVYLAFEREGSGNSGFSFFVDNDCNHENGDPDHLGADFAAFFDVSSNSVGDTTLYEWDDVTGDWVDTGGSLIAFMGPAICGSSSNTYNFFELAFSIPDIHACEVSAECSDIIFLVGSTTAGGSFGSAVKDTIEADISLTVNSGPLASFVNTTPYCENNLVSFDATASLYSTVGDFEDYMALVEWDFDYDGTNFTVDYSETGDAETLPSYLAIYTYTAVGDYTVALRVTDSYDCIDIATQIITVNGSPIATIETTIENCDGPLGTITVTASLGVSPYTFSINGGAFQNSATNIFTFTDLEAGDYTIIVKDGNGCLYEELVTVGIESGCCSLDITCPPDFTETVECYNIQLFQ